ncbi:hypothetical protein Dimus_016413 [Dionaea muscipula]
MKFTCLSKGGDHHFPPCHILDVCGFRVLLDCPLDLSSLAIFSPLPPQSNRRPQGDVSDFVCHVPSNSESMGGQKKLRSDGPFDSNGLICGVPRYKTVNNLHLWDVSFIDVVLISSPAGMLGLPFLTRKKGFSAKIYATEVTRRLGQLMMEDLASMHREFKQFYGPDASASPEWLKWDELEMLPPLLKGLVLGKDGTHLGSWLPLYSAVDVKECIQKIEPLKYAEEACYNGVLVIKAFSSGLDIGTCNWTLSGPKREVAYLCSFACSSAPAMNFNWRGLQSHDTIIYSDFSSLDGKDNCGNNINHSAQMLGSDTFNCDNDEGPSLENLLNSDENSEVEKLGFILSCIVDSIRAGGSILIPLGQLRVILQLLDQIELSQEISTLKVPIFIVSSIGGEVLSFTNTIPEWLCPQKQEKLFAGEPFFAHTRLLEQKRLHVLPSIFSPELLRLWQEPSIVFCPHWSLRLGPAVHFLQRWRSNKNSLLVLEKGVDADLALLPFKPVMMKVLQCSFLSTVSSCKIALLLEKLCPKLVLLPEDLQRVVSWPNSNRLSFLGYSENKTLSVPKSKYCSELVVSTDLASHFHWRKLRQQQNANIARLKGMLLMDHGKQRLVSDSEWTESSHRKLSLLRWGSLEVEAVLAALQMIGICGTVDKANEEPGRMFAVHITEPGEAVVEVRQTGVVISAPDKSLAALILEAVDSILDSI